jgi:hypothetical protein
MRLSCQNAPAIAVFVAALVLASACGANPSGPLSPELSGDWVAPSVDTYSKFSLQQRGTSVVGTFGDFAANGAFSETFVLTGVAELPHVVLSWTQGGTVETFDATLSEDQLTLTGTLEPGGGVGVFHRDVPFTSRISAVAN